MKFLAAVLERQQCPLSLEELEVPRLDVGQVLVAIKSSGICGKQILEQGGALGPDAYLSHCLGHEAGAIVLETGPGVRHVRVDDHVCCHWRKGLGIDSAPPKYKRAKRDGYVGAGPIATFQELAVISENRMTVVPGDVPFQIIALCGCATTSAFGVINNDARLKLGQSIAVLGCGGVGLNVIQGASLVGGFPIIGVDTSPSAQAKAMDFGATHCVTKAELIRDACPQGVDVFVETTGKPELIEAAYELTASQGKTVLVGQMHWNSRVSIHTLPMHAGKTLFASEGGQTDPSVDIPRYLNLYRNKRLNLDQLIGATAPLQEINKLLDWIRERKVSGRCMLMMGEG